MHVAVVTGTSRGLGEHTARELLNRGWRVLGIARSDAPSTLTGHSEYRHATLDLAELEAVEAWFDRQGDEAIPNAADRFALVNNAGRLGPVAPMVTWDAAAWRNSLMLNVAACGWLMGEALRRFPRTPLRIVNVSSGAASHAYPAWGGYCAGKAALRMLGDVFAVESEKVDAARHPDLSVLDFEPGVLDTAMQQEIRDAEATAFPHRERFVELHRSGALVDPTGPARTIADFVEGNGAPRFETRRHAR